MNQNIKTACFAAAAVLVAVAAFLARPGTPAVDAGADAEQRFFPDFADPLAAVTLEVVKFDEALATKSAFKVAQQNGLWVIPSQENYSADAEEQMKSAASLLIGLTKLGAVSGDKAEHESFGVKDPDEVSVGSQGVGILVRMSDKDGRDLAKLIIGKSVTGQAGQHYVRVPGIDRVYVAKISSDNLTTRFTDWIERDLLAVDPFDIRKVLIDNYSIDETRSAKIQGDRLDLSVDPAADPQWTLPGLKEEEELNKDKLAALKSAIDDLKIVDVDRKPEVLAKNLRTGREMFKDLEDPANEAIFRSLQVKGFFLVPVEVLGKQDVAIASNEGEMVVGLQTGIEYVLRFGEITRDAAGADEADKKDDATAEKKDAKQPEGGAKKKGSNRYMYVVARLNEGLVKKPELTPVPQWKEPESPKPEQPKPEQPKKEGEKPAAPTPEKDAKKDGGCDEGKEKGEAKAPTTGDAKPQAAVGKAAHDAEVKRITEDNQRKQKEYDEKLAAGKKRVAQLNARFADWYYVISDAEFQKMHLTRKDLVQPNKALLNKRAGEAFLAENKAKEGVITTASGLQYKVIKEGTGKTPKATDEVQVNYKGTLIDGTVFDQSKPDMPAEFEVGGVIKGWTEALLLMKEGGKLQLFIPGDLAYGVKGKGEQIGPHAALLFDVELIKVK